MDKNSKVLIIRKVVLVAMIATFFVFSALLSYYLIVNIVLKERVLPNIKLNGENISLKTSGEIIKTYESKYLSTLPETIKYKYKDKEYEVKVSDLSPKLATDYVIAFGKGKDISTILESGTELLTGKINFEPTFEVNLDPVVSKLPFKLTQENSVKIVDKKVTNCESNTYNLSLDKSSISYKLNKALKNKETVEILNEDLFSDVGASTYLNLCDKYNLEIERISKALNVLKTDISDKGLNQFSLKTSTEESTNPAWIISNEDGFRKILLSHKASTDQPIKDGVYEIIDNKIHLYSEFQPSKSLEVEESLKQIKTWLVKPNDKLPLVYTERRPSVMDKNLEILDFTTAYAVGQSRINLYFGDYPNPYVENSRVGLLESENVIVNPGDQFSFYDTIAPSFTDTWRTKNGRYIGSGICNSSTTLFRTALEAGMPILERYNHAWNVPKYDWPYEMNLVDAAYLTTPKADMRFQNDLDYPIKIKIEFSTDPEYEYQKVTFLTSPKAKKREVQLLNFKTWDYKSYGVFKGSFDRIVKQDGVVLRQDNFYSDYTLPYGT